jgi:hypothetical protein
MKEPVSEEKITCPICNSKVSKKNYRRHMDIERYVLDVIAAEHPDWKETDGTCTKCVEYYKKL